MTGPVDPESGEIKQPKATDPVSFMKIAYASVGLDPGDIPTATHWPSISADKAANEWEQLRAWVDQLRQRFEFLDHHVIPSCWWLHNGHVETLAALRDHERVSFGELAPATGPVEWLRAVRDIAALLHSWTADLACSPVHKPPIESVPVFDQDAWTAHLDQDTARRQATRKVVPAPP